MQSQALNAVPPAVVPLTHSSTRSPGERASSSSTDTSSSTSNFSDRSVVPSPVAAWQSHSSPSKGVATSSNTECGPGGPSSGATLPPTPSARDSITVARSTPVTSNALVPTRATGSTPWLPRLKELGHDPGLMSSLAALHVKWAVSVSTQPHASVTKSVTSPSPASWQGTHATLPVTSISASPSRSQPTLTMPAL